VQAGLRGWEISAAGKASRLGELRGREGVGEEGKNSGYFIFTFSGESECAADWRGCGAACRQGLRRRVLAGSSALRAGGASQLGELYGREEVEE